jgi:hypothetical protein
MDYKKYAIAYRLGEEKGLSVVVTDEVFDRVCDLATGLIVLNDSQPERAGDFEIAKLRQCGIIPLVRRGNKSQVIFDFLSVDRQYEYLSVIRRGASKELLGLDFYSGEND